MFIPQQEEVLKNLLEQLLNISCNKYNDFDNISKVFSIYHDILSINHLVNEKALLSLKNSQMCFSQCNTACDKITGKILYPLLYQEAIITSIKNLNTDDNSFLIFPLISTNHLLSAVVRKLDNNKYSVVLVNTAAKTFGNDSREKYEEYIYLNENNLFSVLNFPRLTLLTEQIYERILLYSSSKLNQLKVESSTQIIGNCFIKQIEKAIKFALLCTLLIKKSVSKKKTTSEPLRDNWFLLTGVKTDKMHNMFLNRVNYLYGNGYFNTINYTNQLYFLNKNFRAKYNSVMSSKNNNFSLLIPKDLKHIFTQNNTLLEIRNLDIKSVNIIKKLLISRKSLLLETFEKSFIKQLEEICTVSEYESNINKDLGTIYSEMVQLTLLKEKYPVISENYLSAKKANLLKEGIFLDLNYINNCVQYKKIEEMQKKMPLFIKYARKPISESDTLSFFLDYVNEREPYSLKISDVKMRFPFSETILLINPTDQISAQEISNKTGLNIQFKNVFTNNKTMVSPIKKKILEIR